jgi:Domain of unknown function (DUF4402)
MLKQTKMKKMIRFFAAITVMFAFAATTFAQVSATATATATIITPIAIANAVNMNFGNVAVNATPGTVVLTPASTRTATGGVTLPAVTGVVAAGSFTVTGQANATYAITLPGAATTITSGANNMTVDTWTSTPTPTGTLSAGGTQTLNVGATLHVAASQAAGTYVSGVPFQVTVNYN